jgi:hypothetical protein
MIIIGTSHATRLIGSLAEFGQRIVNIAKPGWIVDEETVADIKNKLKKNQGRRE